MKKLRQWLRPLLLSLILLSLLPGSALAREWVDLSQTASLTIRYPVADVAFRLYQAAEFSRTGTLSLTEAFADCGVSIDQPDQAGWKGATEAMAAWTARERIEPSASGKTGPDGTAVFTGLAPGLYLVLWEGCTSGGYLYTPEPFLISLPGLAEDDSWVYSITADPKYGKTSDDPTPSNPGTVDRKVLKVWKDAGHEDLRPEEIRVQLLRDGEVYDTVTLSAENGWRHTWEDLSKQFVWQVIEEDVPDGYTVTVTREGITFVVTNTAETEIPEETPPGDSGEPGTPDDGTDIPEEPVPQGPMLPQTGVLWWPVPLLACGGMALFLAGWALRRKEGDHEA